MSDKVRDDATTTEESDTAAAAAVKVGDEAFAELLKSSVCGVYTNDGEGFATPQLEKNSFVNPILNSRAVTLRDNQDEGGAEPVTPVRIPKVELIEAKEGIWLDPIKVKINFKGRHVPSVIGVLPRPLQYANEFEVLHLVLNQVYDVLSCLGLKQVVAPFLEVGTLYTLIPDRVINLHAAGTIFMTIHVRSPGEDRLFKSKTLVSQIWSNLFMLKQRGNSRPMSAICTFDKVAWVALDDYGNDAGHREVQKEVESALTMSHTIQDRGSSVDERFHQIQYSHERPTRSVGELVQVLSATPPQAEKKVVFMSPIYKNEMVFPALLSGLLTGFLNAMPTILRQGEPTVNHGDDLSNRHFLAVTRTGFDWERTPAHFQLNLKGGLPTDQSKFYLLGLLGSGNEGDMYVACDTVGNCCAIKVFRIEKSVQNDDKYRQEAEQNWTDEAWDEAREESRLWKELYGDRFAGTEPLYLATRPCLVLPFGKAIDDTTIRPRYFDEIKAVLGRFAELGYCYNELGVGWRHIRLDGHGKVFLAGLASLVPLADEDKRVSVDKEMKSLKKNVCEQF